MGQSLAGADPCTEAAANPRAIIYSYKPLLRFTSGDCNPVVRPGVLSGLGAFVIVSGLSERKNLGMIRFCCHCESLLIAIIGSHASAQETTPKIQVFGGYSLLAVDNGKLSGTTLDTSLHEHNSPFALGSNLRGWNAEGQYNFNRWLGLVADVAGRYGTPITESRGTTLTGLPTATGYTFLGGPVVTFRNKSRVTPFLHALFGVDRYSLSASTISGLTTTVTSSNTPYTDFAAALGGGLDVRLVHHIALRLVQLDDLETTHNLNKFYDSAFTPAVFNGLKTHERSLRVSAGIVVSF